jgi:hypothetical protein
MPSPQREGALFLCVFSGHRKDWLKLDCHSLLRAHKNKTTSYGVNMSYFPHVKPMLESAGHASVTTAATGTNWTAFAAQLCSQLTVSNDTGTDLEFRQDGAGVTFTVFDTTYYTFFGLTNASQIEVRRKDTSNTQVTAKARWEA